MLYEFEPWEIKYFYSIELTKQTSERDADLISSTQEKYRKQLREQLINREISPSEYAEGVLSMSNLNMTGTQWYTAYGNEYSQKISRENCVNTVHRPNAENRALFFHSPRENQRRDISETTIRCISHNERKRKYLYLSS